MKKLLTLMLVLALVLVGCGNAADDSTAPADGEAAGEAKTITTTVDGHNGSVEVTTTFDAEGKITAVEVGNHEETDDIADPAIAEVPAAIVENNSVSVDTVSEATVTSNAIIEGVKAAITEAGYNVEDYQ